MEFMSCIARNDKGLILQNQRVDTWTRIAGVEKRTVKHKIIEWEIPSLKLT